MAEQERDDKIIWFIDNEESQLRLYRRKLTEALEEMLGAEADLLVQECPARAHKHQYLDILEDPRTVAIVIDQILKDKGGVDHTGIELAQYLRAVDNIMPLYILTNEPAGDEYVGGEWTVEDIIDKGELIDQKRKKIVTSRLLRRITLYQQAYNDREKRFRQLLKQSLTDSLSDKEQQELDELEFGRIAATVARERVEQTMPDKLDEALEQLQHLRAMIAEFEEDVT